jgi:hypothetical protein
MMAIPGFTAEQSLRAFQLRYHLRNARSAGARPRLRLMQVSETGVYGCPPDLCDGGGGGSGGGGGGDGGWGGTGDGTGSDGTSGGTDETGAGGTGDGTTGGTTDGTVNDGTTDSSAGDGTPSDTTDDGTVYAGPDAGTPTPPTSYTCDALTCSCWDAKSCDDMDRAGACNWQPAGQHYAFGGCTTTPGCTGISYPDCPCTCNRPLVS